METRRWLNHSQPQMLQNANVLLYLNAAFAIFALLAGNIFQTLSLIGIAAGFGIANEKKWGYYLALGVAIIPLALDVLGVLAGSGVNTNLILRLLFEVLLVALLLHPMSRDYQRIWFK